MSMGRMMTMRSGRNNGGQGGSRRYANMRNEYEGSVRDEYDSGVYDYDRWRYENGRFAPKGRGHRTRAEMEGDEEIYDAYGGGRGGSGSRGRNRGGGRTSTRSYYDGGSYDSMYMRGESNYFPDDVSMHYGQEREDQQRKLGFAVGHEKLDKRVAEEWTRHMRNEDGTTGPHWNMEQAKQIMQQNNIECDPAEFYAALNMMYSDYCKVAKEFNVNESAYYAKLAKAFLEDKDAGDGKLLRYYECVVK